LIAADLVSDPAWRRRDAILTVVLFVCVALIWFYFSN
jgi:hypothetical protein